MILSVNFSIKEVLSSAKYLFWTFWAALILWSEIAFLALNSSTTESVGVSLSIILSASSSLRLVVRALWISCKLFTISCKRSICLSDFSKAIWSSIGNSFLNDFSCATFKEVNCLFLSCNILISFCNASDVWELESIASNISLFFLASGPFISSPIAFAICSCNLNFASLLSADPSAIRFEFLYLAILTADSLNCSINLSCNSFGKLDLATLFLNLPISALKSISGFEPTSFIFSTKLIYVLYLSWGFSSVLWASRYSWIIFSPVELALSISALILLFNLFLFMLVISW